MLYGDVASDGASSKTEEDEVLERYPGRARRAPQRYGQGDDQAGANAAAANAKGGSKSVEIVKDLRLPPKTVKEAISRNDWEL